MKKNKNIEILVGRRFPCMQAKAAQTKWSPCLIRTGTVTCHILEGAGVVILRDSLEQLVCRADERMEPC